MEICRFSGSNEDGYVTAIHFRIIIDYRFQSNNIDASIVIVLNFANPLESGDGAYRGRKAQG